MSLLSYSHLWPNNQKAIREYLALADKYPNIALTGSLMLILLGVISQRDVHDLDILTCDEKFNVDSRTYLEYEDSHCLGKLCPKDGLQVHVLLHTPNEMISRHLIVIDNAVRGIMLGSYKTALSAKFAYLLHGSDKHLDDIMYYLKETYYV